MSYDLLNSLERSIDRTVADTYATDFFTVPHEKNICSRGDNISAVDYISLQCICGRHLHSGTCDNCIQLFGSYICLFGSDSEERFEYAGIVLLAEIIAHLANDLGHLADIIVFVKADIRNVFKPDIIKAGLIVFLRIKDSLQLSYSAMKLRHTDLRSDIEVITLDCHELGKLLHGRIAVRQGGAFYAYSTFSDCLCSTGNCHVDGIPDLDIKLDVFKARNIFHDFSDKCAEFIRHHNACSIADCDLVSTRINGSIQRLIQEFRLCAGRILSGEFNELRVETGLLYGFRNELEHCARFLMAHILHLNGRNRSNDVELRFLSRLNALPCLLNIAD